MDAGFHAAVSIPDIGPQTAGEGSNAGTTVGTGDIHWPRLLVIAGLAATAIWNVTLIWLIAKAFFF